MWIKHYDEADAAGVWEHNGITDVAAHTVE
jgi:hypothetical protein